MTATEVLKSRLTDGSGVYHHAGVDRHEQLRAIAESIERNLCEPFPIKATVVESGFKDTSVGSQLSGLCVACKSGYWLVYDSSADSFYCFWGVDVNNLGAHGVFGMPLYCWSA
jgi:hypothetical protein